MKEPVDIHIWKRLVPSMRVALNFLFCVVLLVTLWAVDRVFREKDLHGEAIEEFFSGNHGPDDFDVLAFGPSYVYCTLNPAQLYRDTGLRSFVPGTSIQPVEASYHYIRMALKKYHPKLVILGASMFVFHPAPVRYKEGCAHMASDHIPFSLDKIRFLRDQHLEDSIENYLVPWLKYHSRWKNLKKGDLLGTASHSPTVDVFMGFQLNTGCVTNQLKQLNLTKIPEAEMSGEYLDCLQKIAELCAEKKVRLLLLNAPRANALAEGRLVSLHRYARELGIDFLDLNEVLDETGIDNHTDYHDTDHLNVFGAAKATRYIGRYLQKRYGLPVDNSPAVCAEWNALCAKYDKLEANVLVAAKARKR